MLKEALREGRLLLDDLIDLCPPGAASARVFDVITWAPYFNRTKATRLMRRLREPEYRTLQNMSERQRRELVELLIRHHPKALYGAARREYV